MFLVLDSICAKYLFINDQKKIRGKREKNMRKKSIEMRWLKFWRHIMCMCVCVKYIYAHEQLLLL